MEKELYYSLKKSIATREPCIPLSEICSIHGAESAPLMEAYITVEKESTAVSAFEMSMALKKLYPDYSLSNTGPSECVIVYSGKKPRRAPEIIKAALLCAVMFIGGAFTIITFHEDVGMRAVMSDIYMFFTGVEAQSVPVVSIPYSVGIALGFILLFGLFRRRRPSVLDLDIFAQDKTLKEYIADKKDSDG